MSKIKPLVLIDASSYLYRAFHALPPLMTSKGQPTGAAYGVINMVRKLLADYDPDYVALVFDAKGKTFRDDLYPEYKAHRPSMPDDLSVQIEPLHAIIQALGLPMLMIEGVEADDVIGTLAAQAAAQGIPALISTGDKDIAQLVNEHVTLINTMSNQVLDPAGVEQKFGIPPNLIVDYLTLVGDPVDNVPGVAKVGPTTAVKWLKQYGSLDNIIAHAGEIKGKVGENLRAALPQLPMSRELLIIKCDVPLAVSVTGLKRRSPELETLREWYTRLEFKGWLKELEKGEALGARGAGEALGVRRDDSSLLTPHRFQAPHPSPVQIITNPTQFNEWFAKLEQSPLICISVQTDTGDYMQAKIVGLSFAWPDEAVYIPLGHIYADAPQQLSLNDVLERLRPLLEDAALPKLGHDLKYAMCVLRNHGIKLAGLCYDSMLESYVLDSTATRHDLDSLAYKYLGGRRSNFEEFAGKGAKQLSYNQIPIEQAAAHAAEDAALTLRLHEVLWPRIIALPGLHKLYAEIEMPLAAVLARMQLSGVRIDAAMLRQQSQELAARLQELERQAHDVAGQPFNLGSPLQIQEILYDKMGLPVLQKTPKGQPSTAEAVLQELALDYALPKLILEHRALSKLKSTYTDTLPEQINPSTGRIHTCYQQAVAATGRLSSSDPNLQNIPIRTQEGRRIRQAFTAEPGYKILAADYSQIELRIMAHLSGDTGLIRAFAEAADIHQITAAEVFGVPLAEVSTEQRRSAKAINFGLIYGMSSFGLARQLGVDRAAAQDYIDRYFRRYPGVQAFMDKTRIQARKLGYVETLFGRRLYLPEINVSNAQRRQYAERTAINAPMQGTAADIIKLAMLRVQEWLDSEALDARMIMQVHDELVFEVAEQALEQAREPIRRLMSEVAKLSVPLVVDIGVGNNWDEAH
ncbi:MAG: DNA polymerase I [Gammaproteobacteria bacterium]|nr:DNA polymerase I [Gammaproteobacteria bacterium]